jgi:hypothetical protein
LVPLNAFGELPIACCTIKALNNMALQRLCGPAAPMAVMTKVNVPFLVLIYHKKKYFFYEMGIR